jgi:uncharacterized membrane protein
MDICYMLAACIAQEETEKLIFCNFRNTESFYFILACTGLFYFILFWHVLDYFIAQEVSSGVSKSFSPPRFLSTVFYKPVYGEA